MNQYDRIYGILKEMSKEDLYHYKGRPSRTKVKKKSRTRLRSKKTQASYDKAAKREAQAETDAFRSGGRGR